MPHKSLMKIPIVATLILLVAAVLSGQSWFAPPLMSDVSDWTDQHVLFPEAHDAFTLFRLQQDHRFRFHWNRRHPYLCRLHAGAGAAPNPAADWSVSLGGGSTGAQSFPSKFSFDVTQPPDCTRDFVVTGVNAPGSAMQANIIAVNNLYSNSSGTGFCSGTGPRVMFAYNVGPGTVPASVVISLDGRKIAFIENNGAGTYFHVLTYRSGIGNGSSASRPVSPPPGADVKLRLNQASTATVFVDYSNDTAYATTEGINGTMYKISGVFFGTPALVTTNGWPITLPGIIPSAPVHDFISKHVFFKGMNGTVYYVDDSVAPAHLSNTTWVFAPNDSTAHPVIVDATNQKIYAYTPGASNGSALVGQATTNLTNPVTVAVGAGVGVDRTTRMPDFSNAYYSGTTNGAYLYIAGNNPGLWNHPPALYRIGFNSAWLLNSLPTSGPLDLATNTANVNSSAVTEFYNTTTNKEYLFVGVSNGCGAPGISGGCRRSLDITNNTWPSAALNHEVLAADGGTSGVIVDNVSSVSEASSVYYITMTGNALVKAAQGSLR